MAVAVHETVTADGFELVVRGGERRAGLEVHVARSEVIDLSAASSSQPIAVFELGVEPDAELVVVSAGAADVADAADAGPTGRSQHRAVARDLRGNAGVDVREHVEAVADFGAAARRLRASVRGGSDAAPARPRSHAAARRAVVPAAAVEPVEVVESVESVESAKKRESVTLRYLRNRRAAKA